MEGYIDIHNHILPNIDDGAKNIEQAKNMFKIAYDEGIRTIIATPHYDQERNMGSLVKMEESFKRLKDEIASFMPQMKLELGCEINYSYDIIRLLNEKQIPTMSNSRYVLIEFNPASEYSYISNSLQKLLFEGYKPILAHVERYEEVVKEIDRVEELINMGFYIQVNASSIIGERGIKRKRITKKLLKNDLIHFVGTDAHGDKMRPPTLKVCAEYIKNKFGQEYAKKILINHANKILENEKISI